MAAMERLRSALAFGAVVLLVGRGALSGGSTFARAEDDPLFSLEGPVAKLSRSTFISSVLEATSPALVWFYSGEDCPQCVDVAGKIESAASKLTSWGMSVAAVDLSEEAKLKKELGLPKSLPMMLKVYHSESTRNPYGGLPVRPEDYIDNFQDSRSLQKKALSAVPNVVSSVDVNEEKKGSALKEALAEGEEGFTAVLLTEAGKSSPVLRVLASQLKGKVKAVQARVAGSGYDSDDEEGDKGDSLSDLLEDVLDVTGWTPSAPSLVLVDRASGKGVHFDGEVDDAQGMLDFIRKGAGLSDSTASDSSTSSHGSDADSIPVLGGVLKLDPESLGRLEEKGTEALVVAFVEGGDASVIPGWSEATKGLQGQIRAAVADCSAHPSLCEGSSKKAPHVRVYPHRMGFDGEHRSVPSVLRASELKEAVSEAEASLPELVTVIPAGTGSQRIQEVVQAFVGKSILGEGSPMCLFVLSKKTEPNSVVKTIAAEFQTAKIKTMFISQPDQEVMAGLGLSKLPALLLMFPATAEMSRPPGARQPAEGEEAMMTVHYSPMQWGPVSHTSVKEFILSNLSSVNKEVFFAHLKGMSENAALSGEKLPMQLERFIAENTGSGEGSSSVGGDSAPPSPFMGVSEATLETWQDITGERTGRPRNVGVFLLDRHSESFGSALKAAEVAAEKASVRVGGDGGGGGSFAWVDAPCQEGFARTLGFSDASEVPGLVVFSPKHQKSARFVGAWEAESMSLFLGKALVGRAPMFPVGDAAPRLEDVDCSQRELPASLAGGDGEGEGGIGDEDMGDFMAEILAEEARAKRELEEEVAKGLEEMKEAEAEKNGEASAKRKTKTVKRKKKKSASGNRSEL